MKNKWAKLGGAGAAVLAAAMGGSNASATGFTLGDAANYIILYEGNGGHHLAINNFGTTGIWHGNIGIAGTGTLAASGPGTIAGDVNFSAANTGQASVSNTGFTSGHGINYGVSAVAADMAAMNTLSSTFGALAGSGTSLAIDTPGSGALTIQANSGAALAGALSGNRLFNVTSFSSNNGENLIIQGNGSENVVFDFGHDTQFHGNILLQDLAGKFYGDNGYAGLTPDQVLFNLYGGAALTGGDTLDANNNGNDAHPANNIFGTFLDPNGPISFVNTRFTGHIYGGDSTDMQIVSGDTLTLPVTITTNSVTPDTASTALLALLGLGSLVAFRKKIVA